MRRKLEVKLEGSGYAYLNLLSQIMNKEGVLDCSGHSKPQGAWINMGFDDEELDAGELVQFIRNNAKALGLVVVVEECGARGGKRCGS